MSTELVNLATSEKLSEMDWTKTIQICELVAEDQRRAKDVTKAIKKRLCNKHPNVQLHAVLLLEMLMNNIGEPIHREVIDAGLLDMLVKIVKKKSDLPVRERIFLLLDATQTSLGGGKGRFPQYYDAYYELVSAGVQFPRSQHIVSTDHTSSTTRQINVTVRQVASGPRERTTPQEEPRPLVAPESREAFLSPFSPSCSIIKKATAALEVLKEVLDAVDAQNPQAGKDEFTLDLVEQCSFQKQRVMHLVMTSRNERLVSQAIELNEQLGRVLARHDALLMDRPQTTSNHFDHDNLSAAGGDDTVHSVWPALASDHVNHEEAEKEDEAEVEQLSRRIKGKARLRPKDEDGSLDERPFGLFGSCIPDDKLHRPLMRPLSLEPPLQESKPISQTPLIPPPPSKYTEREKFFQEKGDATALAGHMRAVSLHSRNASSSRSGSIDSTKYP